MSSLQCRIPDVCPEVQRMISHREGFSRWICCWHKICLNVD